jgi:hypothetical protein
MITTDKLNEAEGRCLGAVTHVGIANYHERERAAKQWVRDTFNQLRSEIYEVPEKVRD